MSIRVVAAAAAVLAGTPALAVNLVANPGFETGDFTSWTQFGNTSDTSVAGTFGGILPTQGVFQASLGANGSRGGIRQTLVTEPGQFYKLSFDLYNFGGVPSYYGFFWDGVSQEVKLDAVAFPYTRFTFVTAALDAATTLAFRFQNDPASFLLDNVTVTAVPEPQTWAMIVAGFGLVGFGLRSRRRTTAA